MQILRPNAAYFWGTHAGGELDLVFQLRGKRYGMEFKFSEAPTLTASMRMAAAELSLDHLWIVFPGKDAYPVAEKISALPLQKLHSV